MKPDPDGGPDPDDLECPGDPPRYCQECSCILAGDEMDVCQDCEDGFGYEHLT